MALSDDKVYLNAKGTRLLDTPASKDRNYVFEKAYAKYLNMKNGEEESPEIEEGGDAKKEENSPEIKEDGDSKKMQD